jgi:hypothetical protein
MMSMRGMRMGMRVTAAASVLPSVPAVRRNHLRLHLQYVP